MRKNVESFVKTCHPCQLVKSGPAVDPGIGHFSVPDQRFSAIHLDVVGPLPESEGQKYLLTVLCRTSRWLEAYPMASASSLECSKAFMQWASRFGVPRLAISDNGNSFVANLYQDMMKTFNVDVKFTPAYHAASNGAIERRHQTIKNALKASLIDMGNKHQDKWMRALPWVLLGKRTAYQPDLDTSSAMLAFGRSPLLPGQLLGHPGPPLTNIQTKALLEEMYKIEANPALQTSSKTSHNDISATDNATHVYVRVDEPKGLSSRYEGPYKVISRPSRSQLEVRIGSFANGSPRTSVYHWSSCKPAHLRDDFVEGSRPMLGRKPQSSATPPSSDTSSTEASSSDSAPTVISSPGVSSSKSPHPDYLRKGPLITDRMFDDADWPKILNIPQRPRRSTRNPSPNYVE